MLQQIVQNLQQTEQKGINFSHYRLLFDNELDPLVISETSERILIEFGMWILH